eukprot:TRINITY_DN22824_c0_g1_i1.p3 TRINITY_DN22824_c0_g1~~TRINITY_DN22824_c0_g1_i1.p3  ORF type:complete len:310 (+),score=27.55 TRINITY_DN22824_c0_g1_i1:2088-3017(+)
MGPAEGLITFLTAMPHDLCWLERAATGGGLGKDPLLEHCLLRAENGEVGTVEGLKQAVLTVILLGVMGGVLYLVRWIKLLARKSEDEKTRELRKLVPVQKKDSELTVVLDLDETLVSFGDNAFASKGTDGVRLRPRLKNFLDFLEEADFEVIIWTAATRSYSKCVHEALAAVNPNVIHHRLYRTNSWYTADHVKDLRRLGRDLDKVVMVENRAASGRLQPDNTILVPDFTHRGGGCRGGEQDHALDHVTSLLKGLVMSKQTVPNFLKKTKLARHIHASKIEEDPSHAVFHYVSGKYDSYITEASGPRGP